MYIIRFVYVSLAYTLTHRAYKRADNYVSLTFRPKVTYGLWLTAHHCAPWRH